MDGGGIESGRDRIVRASARGASEHGDNECCKDDQVDVFPVHEISLKCSRGDA